MVGLVRRHARDVSPKDVQRFMLAASVPSAISTRLAREVLGVNAPDPLIERLRGEVETARAMRYELDYTRSRSTIR